MRTRTLLGRNLVYYWRTNLAVVFGVATAVAVLAGALLIGDSVRASLRDLFLSRLGRADQIIASTGFFRERLAGDLQSHSQFSAAFEGACPLIALQGLVTHQESGRRASGVQVYGVDERFWAFHRSKEVKSPGDREVLLSEALAEEFGSKNGDTLLVRVEKPSAIPAESLHGRKDDLGRTLRLTAGESLPATKLGEFSARPQQGAVRAVFVSLGRLQKDLELKGKVNTVLVSERQPLAPDSASLESILKATFSVEDLGIRLRLLHEQGCLVVESDSALISDPLADSARAAAELGMRASSILTYLANGIRSANREIPYSLVSALDSETYGQVNRGNIEARSSSDDSKSRGQAAPDLPAIVLNDWAASDLGVRPGEVLSLDYYVWEEQGRLTTQTARFRLAGIVSLKGAAADRDLAPDYPGITESKSLSDWDPPFPMDLGKIRPRDEEYWDRYRTTPKAFITLEEGQRLWQTRFGKLTSVRLSPPNKTNLDSAADAYRKKLREVLNPASMGLSVYPARAEGLEASRGATDFGEYFVYFSFFLVASALLLTGLFFKLGVEQRLREIGILQTMGFYAARIRALFLGEGVVLAAAGSTLGACGAVAYGGLMMLGLRTWWVGAVGTTLLTLHLSASSLAIGGVAGMITALICIAWTLRTLAPASPRSLLTGAWEAEKSESEKGRTTQRAKATRPKQIGIAFGLAGVLLLAAAWRAWVGQVGGFFGAGTFLLIAFVCYVTAVLRRSKRKLLQKNGWWAVSRLGFRNATFRPGRSVLCISLIASATFTIVALDAFRRESGGWSLDKKSGTGGYALLAESLLPLMHDPNSAEGRENLNLATTPDLALERVTFTRFRVRPGDEASCLNLYRPRSPRILAPTDEFLTSNRFSFQDSVAASQEERANPWLLLRRELPGGAIPVIADANSMTYVLHLKLGEELVLSQSRGDPVRLRIVGALRDSIFQGELLMSESNFLRLFPEQEGFRFFLLDVPPAQTATATRVLEDGLSDFGFDVIPTSERLAEFHRVENTYLSTFQALGGLGLILGTLGLATVLVRNVMERRRELALLRAVGYNSTHFGLMVIAENTLLLLCGLLSGFVCAMLAVIPAIASRGGHPGILSLGLLLLAVVVTGLTSSVLATIAVLRSPLLPALRAE